jgi:hypothetical protein
MPSVQTRANVPAKHRGTRQHDDAGSLRKFNHLTLGHIDRYNANRLSIPVSATNHLFVSFGFAN